MLSIQVAHAPQYIKRLILRAPPEGAALSGKPRQFSVLIVEDDYFVGLGLEQSFHDAGLNVVGIAVTTEQAIELASRESPDIAIVDVRLASEKDGIEAAVELRLKFGIPSIFATAHGDGATKARAKAAEPLGWFTKPYAPSDIVDAVKAAIEEGILGE